MFEKGSIGSYLVNSGLVSLVTVVAGIFINSAAAFALAKLKWRGQGVVLSLVIGLQNSP